MPALTVTARAHATGVATGTLSRPSSRAVVTPGPKKQNVLVAQTIGAAAAVLVALPTPALATGLESVDLPPVPEIPMLKELAEKNAKTLQEADEQFQSSPLLAELKAKSVANKKKNADEIAEKYCRRQAELGIGDCGGLQYVPGYTKSGKQKTPMWLGKLLGMTEEEVNEYNSQIDRLPGTGIGGYR